jgi:hypothetical protein
VQKDTVYDTKSAELYIKNNQSALKRAILMLLLYPDDVLSAVRVTSCPYTSQCRIFCNQFQLLMLPAKIQECLQIKGFAGFGKILPDFLDGASYNTVVA